MASYEHAPRHTSRSGFDSGTEDLVRALENIEKEIQQDAITNLIQIGTPALPELLVAFSDAGKKDLMANAGNVLVHWGNQSRAALADILTDADEITRASAAGALGYLGTSAVPLLVAALHDPSREVKIRAAQSLAQVRWIFTPDQEQEQVIYHVVLGDTKDLVRIKKVAFRYLIELLDDPDYRIQVGAIKGLGDIKSVKALPRLVALLRCEEIEIRSAVIESLGNIKNPKAIPFLVYALNDSSPYVRVEAVWALEKLGWTPQDNQQTVRYLIAKEQWGKLSRIEPEAIPALVPALLDKNPNVRNQVASILLERGTEAVPVLELAITSTNENLKKSATEVLNRIVKDSRQTNPVHVSHGIGDASWLLNDEEIPHDQTLTVTGEDSWNEPAQNSPESPGARIQRLSALLRDPDPDIRVVAVEQLRATGHPAIRPLYGALKDPHKNVRSAAAEALGALKSVQAVPSLIHALCTDPENIVRIASAGSLGLIGDNYAIPYLAGVFYDPSPEVRAAAASALGHIGEPAKNIVISRTRQADARVRSAAYLSLGAMQDPAVARYIIAGFADADPGVRDHAARALETLAHAVPKGFFEVIHGLILTGNVAERSGILDTLATLESEEVIWIAYAVSEDPDPTLQKKARDLIRERAPPLLSAPPQDVLQSEDERTLRELVVQLSDADPAIRAAATARIKKCGRPAIKVLLSALRDNSPELNAGLAEILESMQDVIVDDLINAIHDESPVVRKVAVTVLGHVSQERAVHAIGWVLYGEKEPDIRLVAAKSLGKTGNYNGILPLVHSLDDILLVRYAAIESLGTIGGDSARDALVGSLEHANDDTLSCIAHALERCGNDARVTLTASLMKGSPAFRLNIARVLDILSWQPRDMSGQIQYLVAKGEWDNISALGLPALACLITSFDDDVPATRSEISRIIGHLGEPARLPLIQALSDKRPFIREGAVLSLGYLGGSVENNIVGMLKDPSAIVRYAATLSLDRIKWVPKNDGAAAFYEVARKDWAGVVLRKKFAVSPLVRVLGDRNFEVQAGAIRALGTLGDNRAVPFLILLAEKTEDIRIVLFVISALGRIDGPEVQQFLAGALTHLVFAVRVQAASALEKTGWTPKDTAEKVRFLIALQKPEILAQMGSEAFPFIIEALIDDQVLGRLVITEALIIMGEPAIAGLTGILHGDNTSLREESGHMLEVLKKREDNQPGQADHDGIIKTAGTGGAEDTKRRLAQIRESLEGADENTRMDAVALFEQRGLLAATDLLQLARDDKISVKIAALGALGRIKSTTALPVLIPLLEDPNPKIRRTVVESLGIIRDATAIPALIRCFLDKSGDVRTRAIHALAGMGNLAVHPVLEATGDCQPAIRAAAFETLGKFPDPVVLHPLVKGLDDAEAHVRLTAAKVLGSLVKRPDSPVMDILTKILSEGDLMTRLSALDALAVTDDVRALDLLNLVLQDEDEQIRSRAQEILTRKQNGSLCPPPGENRVLPDEDEISRVIQDLAGRNMAIREEAAKKLLRIGKPAAKLLLSTLSGGDPELHTIIVRVLEVMGGAITDDLVEALENGVIPVRQSAAALLGNIPDPRCVPALGHALYTESDAGTRKIIAESLGRLGDRRGVKALIDILGDPYAPVNLAAIQSLGMLHDECAVKPLILQLNAADEEMVLAIKDGLRQIGEPARADLVNLLRDGDHPRKAIAANILEVLDCIPRDPVEHAYFLIGKEQWYDFENAGTAAFGPLIEVLDDKNVHLRLGAVTAMAKIGEPGAIGPLIIALNDPSPIVRRRAANALVNIGRSVIEPLELALAAGEIKFPSPAKYILHKIAQIPRDPSPDDGPVPEPGKEPETPPPSR